MAAQVHPDSSTLVHVGTAPAAPSEVGGRASRRDWLSIGLGLAVALALGLVLAAVLYVLVVGVFEPRPARTAAERQLSLLQNVVLDKPKSDTAWADYARTLISLKQYSKAAQVIADGLKQVPKSPVILVEKARLDEARADEAGAVKAIDAVVKQVLAARAARKDELAKKGITDDVGRLDSGALISAYLLKAQILVGQEKWKDAIAAYTSALEESPQMADVLVLRAQASATAGDEAGAEKDYRSALTYVPDSKEALEGLKRMGK